MKTGWLKVKSAAAYADVSERTIRTWLKCGLRHVRPNGGSILIKVVWLDEFLENSEVIINEAEKIADEVMSDLPEVKCQF
jgi:excisionase family DNA binding protein